MVNDHGRQRIVKEYRNRHSIKINKVVKIRSGRASIHLKNKLAEIAKQNPERNLNSIHHHTDLDWLRVAYGQLQKDKAPGYDGETVQEYATIWIAD